MIQIDALTVSYGAVKPLDGLSLTIDSPSHGIIGPNGAGKTTLLNACSGFNASVTGRITAFGDEVSAMSARQRARWGLRRTFQTVQLAEDLSVRDNIAIAVDHCPSSGSRHRAVDAACELVGLSHIDRPARGLGTYERRLTEIARAVVGRSRLVLMDEPAAGVSRSERQRLTELLAGLHTRTGVWLILIDHDVELIATVCHTTTALDFGRHITSGPTDDVLADRRVISAYLGSGSVG